VRSLYAVMLLFIAAMLVYAVVIGALGL